MPLSTLTISRSELEKLGDNAVELLREYCEGSEMITKKSLQVPDPKDAELRIVVLDDPESTTLEVSFTVGDDVYAYIDGIPDPSFNPKHEAKKDAANKIQALSEQLGFNCRYVAMEAWSNTVFSTVTAKSAREDILPAFLSEEGSKNIRSSRVKIVVSPSFMEKYATGGPESLGPVESNELAKLRDEIQKHMREILSLDEAHQCEYEFVEALQADAGLSIEVDLNQFNEDILVPLEVLEYLNAKIAAQLVENGDVDDTTQEGDVELWVRQGSPECTFSDNY